MYLINMFDNHIKGSCAWYDLNMMLGLTQILTTSKASLQTGVNLIVKLVTFKMDIDKQAAPLRKKIEKLQWQIDNAVLSEDQIKDKRD